MARADSCEIVDAKIKFVTRANVRLMFKTHVDAAIGQLSSSLDTLERDHALPRHGIYTVVR
jgi:hypothetical protein